MYFHKKLENECAVPVLKTIHKSIAKWPQRLQLCIDNDDSHFELILAHFKLYFSTLHNDKKFFCSTTCSRVIEVQNTNNIYG